MTGWLEILTVAFITQLLVLPGEKVQFIIAGLSTRYDPRVVIGAAGAAFASWTAIEILAGRALKTALSPVVLDVITAALFLLFAILLIRSAPEREATPAEADGGTVGMNASIEVPAILGYDISERLGAFPAIFTMMAAGEFGDKTQLVTIGLAVQYGAHPAIWFGEMLAIIPVSLANAYVFHRFSHRFDARKAHFAGAALFVFFAFDTALTLTTGFSIWGTLISTISDAVFGLL